QPHGGVQGAAGGGIRRRAAQDRHGQDPVARVAGTGESENAMKDVLAVISLRPRSWAFPLGVALLLASAGASAQIEVENPWIRATPPGARMAAGYAVLRNAGTTPDRLVSGQAPGRADRVE